MTAVYPRDAVFNVNNFSTIASVQYNGTGSTTEFILPVPAMSVGQVLAFADGVVQDSTIYDLTEHNGINYSNVEFGTPLYASNLTIKVISVPNWFYVNDKALTVSLVSYSNSTPVTIRSNTYVVDGVQTTFALPITSNTSNKDSIFVVRNGVQQSATDFTFPSATLNIYGVDLLDPPLTNEIMEIRVFDSGENKYVRKTSIASRKVDKGFSTNRESAVRRIAFIAGYEKRRLITRRMKRIWNFSYTNITGIEKEAIEAFYLARSGDFESFSFDLSHLNEQGFVTVRFDQPITITNVLSASQDDLMQNFYNVTVSLKEVDD